jgi:hypothetical protein
MLIALFYYLSTLFGGGEPLLVDIAKPVKQHVAAPERAKQILEINETMQAVASAYAKDYEAQRQSLLALHRLRTTTEVELNAAFAALDARRAAFRQQVIAERTALHALMTAEEWALVYAEQP